MTTIELNVKMNLEPHNKEVTLRIVGNNDDGELLSSNSSRTAPKRVARERSAGDLTKSPARKLKNQPHSIDISEMFYSGDQFTITAYLPNEEMDGEKQTRLKVQYMYIYAV